MHVGSYKVGSDVRLAIIVVFYDTPFGRNGVLNV
jgi:hypothetical protein